MKYLRSQPASDKQKSYCTQAPGELSFIIFIVEGHLKLLIILLFNTVYKSNLQLELIKNVNELILTREY